MNTFSGLIHAESGVGKTWLLSTMPGPRLILDVEGRTKYSPKRKVLWDPRQAIPTDIDEDTTVIVKVKDYSTMDLASQWLQSGQHPFRSFGLDSVTEVQKRSMDQIAGTNQPDQQDWGVLLRRTEKLVRDIRDLADHPTNPLACAIIVAGTQVKDGKQRPMLQGQIANNIPYYVDLNGYYYVTQGPEGELVRALMIQPIGNVVAKDGTDILTAHYGPIISSPNFTDMLAVLNQKGVDVSS